MNDKNEAPAVAREGRATTGREKRDRPQCNTPRPRRRALPPLRRYFVQDDEAVVEALLRLLRGGTL